MTATYRQIPALIAKREAFKGNSMRAEVNPSYVMDGRLNHGEWAKLFKDQAKSGIAYIIYSYATPIAWITKAGDTYKIKQKFSVTTSKHWGLIQF